MPEGILQKLPMFDASASAATCHCAYPSVLRSEVE
jgi:hypothetical protein|eukprot:COSAG01_NODE_303_length_19167_cov_10.792454_22_plen_35_part_00